MASAPTHTVAVNTLAVNPSNEGTRTMLTRLLPALARVAPDLRQLLICSTANRHLFPADADAVVLDIGENQTFRRIGYDQTKVASIARRHADALVTATSVGPIFAGLPHVSIVTAHLALPSCQASAGDDGLGLVHRLYYGAPLRLALRRSDIVLGISEFIAQGVTDELGIDAAKTRAMPLGVDPAPVPPTIDNRKPLALMVGTLYGYKDVSTALRAFALARPRLPSGARLAIAGKDPGDLLPGLRDEAGHLDVADAVDFLGAVSDEELEALYSSASVLLMPSRCEGFGLPAAEAMSRAMPVVAADATSLPGVLGDTGVLVTPGDADGFAQAMVEIMGDDDRRRAMAERSLERATELTWQHSAVHLRDAIYDAITRHGSRR